MILRVGEQPAVPPGRCSTRQHCRRRWQPPLSSSWIPRAQGPSAKVSIPASKLRPGDGAPQLTDHTVEEGGRAARDQQGAAQEAVWRGEVSSLRIGRRILVPRSRFARHFGLDPQGPLEPNDGASGAHEGAVADGGNALLGSERLGATNPLRETRTCHDGAVSRRCSNHHLTRRAHGSCWRDGDS